MTSRLLNFCAIRSLFGRKVAEDVLRPHLPNGLDVDHIGDQMLLDSVLKEEEKREVECRDCEKKDCGDEQSHLEKAKNEIMQIRNLGTELGWRKATLRAYQTARDIQDNGGSSQDIVEALIRLMDSPPPHIPMREKKDEMENGNGYQV